MVSLLCTGNCFIEAILFELGHLASNYTVQSFRAEMLEYIKLDLVNYITPIWITCCQIYPPQILQSRTRDEIISKYLTDLQQDGFPCGFECINAVCNWKQMKINLIFVHPNKTVSFIPKDGIYFSEAHLIWGYCHQIH